ncbi:Polysulphide reductase, NrfD [Magnetococcus marinus MC-1]|uniref:Polysulphide reductase, NrfD n=1 Tax=Magnetococcus marinus (strain ATCC BAA-1437 / JCM 17883 / MC-1) TaxID=156889 RepID=A0LAL1_MAGMM|nr:Ni/Fe-hydrogenase cytochrome b subunit [Magnetococcus marinus]ABK45004.1 Polysulphide reductase, NrfD [Magnetococcus marinus MC-1]
MSHYSSYQPIGTKLLTKSFLFLGVIAAIGIYFMAQRFIHGMGAVSNLNGGYPWGIWVVYDVVVGTALACGGYALAITIYVFNKGEYHPLIRPAILASLLGYALGGFGALFDMGRWWQFYNILLPWNWNFNSVMLEVGLCVFTYIMVLLIEFAPVPFEKAGKAHKLKSLNKVLFFFLALGVLLPTMHQSSLGSMLIVMGYKIDPLWQSLQLQPLLAILTAIIMGFSVVIFEASMSTVGLAQPAETPLLQKLAKAIVWLVSLYLLVRFGELLLRGKLGLLLHANLNTLMFLIETALFVVPLLILKDPLKRSSAKLLLIAGMGLLLAGSLYRFNAFLIGYNPGPGYSYFPSAPEIMVTLGVIAIEIMAYLTMVKIFPVLHRAKHA